MKYYNIILSVILVFNIACKQESNQVDNDTKKKNQDKKISDKKSNNQTIIDFSQNEIKLNGVKLFKLSKEELIQSLGLSESDTQKGFAYFHGENKFEISETEIVFFRLIDSHFSLSSPNLSIGMNESELKKKFPNAYARLTDDYINEIELKSFEMYDINDNKLRIYLKDGKIYRISYFAFENL